MAQKIKKLVSFTDAQWDMLQRIMEQEGITAVSVALGYLISEETKRRHQLYQVGGNLPITKIE